MAAGGRRGRGREVEAALRLNPYVKFMRGQRAVSRLGVEGKVEGAKKSA